MNFLQKKISLSQLDILHLDISQKIVFQSAIGTRPSKQALIVRWTDREGNIGYGESSSRPDPFYSDEFISASKLCLEAFVFPFLKEEQTYGEVLQVLRRVRGWNFTKAAVEYAMHDLIERRDGESIFDEWKRPTIDRIPIGISLGIQKDKATFEEVVGRSMQAKYRRLKFKIMPGMDWREGRKSELESESEDAPYISFDANGTFLRKDLPQLEKFIAFGNALEQPFPPHRIDIYRAAKQQFPGLKVCADEEVKGIGDLMKLHELKAIDELNIKPGRIGGLYNSIQIAHYCLDQGIPAWVGGMFETGIGRALNVRFAAHLPNATAHDLSPSSRYFERDIVKQPLKMDTDGYMQVSQAKGVEIDEEAIEAFLVDKISLSL
jgi:O-succinylbenzoate synthase